MRRRGFTLIELLIVIALIGIMATGAVVSLRSGKDSIRLSGATRTVMSQLRAARSKALITQKPVLLTYSNTRTEEGEPAVQVTVKGEKLYKSDNLCVPVYTLSGEILNADEVEAAQEAALAKEKAKSDLKGAKAAAREDAGLSDGAGETVEEVLEAPVTPVEVGVGLKLKFLRENEELQVSETVKRSSVSIFSTVDNVSRTYETGAAKEETASSDGADEATEATVSVVFAANGTVDPPHKVWIFPEGTEPDSGLCIEVDRFGTPHCHSKGEN